MKDSTRFGFGIIGCGVVGHKHAQEIGTLPDARLIGVADILPERADEASKRYGVRGYATYHDLLADPEVQIVTICVPSGLHAQVAVDAARAGKHLIVEKPIDVTLANADWLLDEAEQAGVVLSVVSQHRFDSSTRRLKEAVEAGKLGKVFLGQASIFWYRSQGYYDSGDWRGTYALDGGGALINQSIHTVDLLQYLMGPVAEVYAQVGTYAHQIEVEDTAVATVKFQTGAIATIAATTAAYPGLSARLEVFGEKGSAVIDGDNLTHLYQMEDPTPGILRRIEATNLADLTDAGELSPLWLESSAHRLQFQDVMDAIRSKRPPLVTGLEGRKALETVLAIYHSAKTGEVVRFPYC